jgi:hypothetical protein
MHAISALAIAVFALAQNSRKRENGHAFQASSPKNFQGRPPRRPFFCRSPPRLRAPTRSGAALRRRRASQTCRGQVEKRRGPGRPACDLKVDRTDVTDNGPAAALRRSAPAPQGLTQRRKDAKPQRRQEAEGLDDLVEWGSWLPRPRPAGPLCVFASLRETKSTPEPLRRREIGSARSRGISRPLSRHPPA